MKRTGVASTWTRVALAGVLTAATLLSAGCNNAAEGGLSGAALGAGAGAIIGSLYGDFGTGDAIGAVAGGLGGAVVGDQNARNAQYGGGYRDYSPRDRVVYYEPSYTSYERRTYYVPSYGCDRPYIEYRYCR